eukprot:GHVS01091808.1.p1 GENE.GHVS01091808.1~~GHVS01091808.1.p1  ORF type:complete len:630 (+),score=108.58 GHVS01091808.1:46-1935(+)
MPSRSEFLNNFTTAAGFHPDYIVETPARVNLIGEHIDYNGFAVLPIAINSTMWVGLGRNITGAACSASAPGSTVAYLSLKSLNSQLNHPLLPHHFETFSELLYFLRQTEQQPKAGVGWCRYVVAAYLGVIDYVVGGGVEMVGTICQQATSKGEARDESDLMKKLQAVVPGGVTLVVNSNIPMGSGLSSSSSLVVSVMNLLSLFIGIDLTPTELAAAAAKAEKYTGTAGGGMDQASICLSHQHSGGLISFLPFLSVCPVRLPSNLSIVLADSGIVVLKGDTHKYSHFNKRVFECKIALKRLMVNRTTRALSGVDVNNITLKEYSTCMKWTLKECIAMVSLHVPAEETSESVEELFADSADELTRLLDCVGEPTFHNNGTFHPRSRALHVFTEASRVLQFAYLCHLHGSAHPPQMQLQEKNSTPANSSSSPSVELYGQQQLYVQQLPPVEAAGSISRADRGKEDQTNQNQMGTVGTYDDAVHMLQQMLNGGHSSNDGSMNGKDTASPLPCDWFGEYASCNIKDFPISKVLGDLFTASNRSCQVDYDCTGQQLGAVIQQAYQCGAIGARQTGAGWGGYAIALVELEAETEFIQKWKNCAPRPLPDVFAVRPFGSIRAYSVSSSPTSNTSDSN